MPVGSRTSASIRGCLMAAALLGAVACDRAPEAPPAPPTELEPAAADLLRRVSQDLGALSTFRFETSTTRERVRYNGEKETQSFVQHVVVRRPNAFSLHRDLDGVAQVALYDGENVTFRNDNEKVWGRVGAPDNLNDTLEFLADALRVPVSMGDLFVSDPYSAFVGEQTLGRVVGTEDVGGRACQHATFVDPALDFEIWVPVEGPAYPCRLRMVYKTAEGSPQTVVDFSDWQANPEIPADQFAFAIPEGYHRIPVAFVPPPEPEESTEADSEPAADADASDSGS